MLVQIDHLSTCSGVLSGRNLFSFWSSTHIKMAVCPIEDLSVTRRRACWSALLLSFLQVRLPNAASPELLQKSPPGRDSIDPCPAASDADGNLAEIAS